MSVEAVPLAVTGALLLKTRYVPDERGVFAKPYSSAMLADALPDFAVREVFWSRSAGGTTRGLHFQYPPTAVAKLVFVIEGRIVDAVLDLRSDSPTFGQHAVMELCADDGVVYVPTGCAHGFEVIDGPAVTCYLQDGAFDPATDAGVRWNSAGISWTNSTPRVSPRDAGLPDVLGLDFPTTDGWAGRG